MAKFVLKDASVSVDGTDLSAWASSVTIDTPADEVEITTFGGDYREFAQGLKDATITVAFFQDFGASAVHATLGPLHEAGTAFDLVIKPTSDAVGATNPSWTTSVVLYNYQPLAAAVGEAATLDVSFRHAGQLGVVEAVV